jgi:hypothetical protein
VRPVFVMVVGPGEAHIALHTLKTIRQAHAGSTVIVRDDATTDGTGELIREWADGTQGVTVLTAAKPYGYRGIARSMFEVASHATRIESDDDWMLVKVDPDTLLIGTDLTNAAQDHFSCHGPGLIGAIRVGPAGSRTSHRERRNLKIDMLPAGPSKTGRKIRVGLPFWAPNLRRARRSGYRTGPSVQGGFFILDGRSIRELADVGYWDGITDRYSAMTYEEDILLSLGVASIGRGLYELDDLGVPWWVQHKPPLPFNADEAAQRGLRVVHPLKDDVAGWEIRDALAR